MNRRRLVSEPTQLQLSLSADLVDRIDVWTNAHDVDTRNDAIRQLLELGLTVKLRHSASTKQRDRAATLAGRQIDQMSDASASNEDRASRKQRLTEGPSVFRAVRRDRSKKSETK
jgi:metal-responsive CopG/Arc/MetJ family transcriptional regulator